MISYLEGFAGRRVDHFTDLKEKSREGMFFDFFNRKMRGRKRIGPDLEFGVEMTAAESHSIER